MNLRRIFAFLPPRLTYSEDVLPIEEFTHPKKTIILQNSSEPVNFKVGDSLQTGQRLAISSDGTGPFSPVSGNITEISTIKWTDAKDFTAIIVDTSETDVWDSSFQGKEDYQNKDVDDVLTQLNKLGFDFGIDIKDKRIDTVIINCLDSDLLISVNQQILREKIENITEGLQLIKRILNPGKIILAVSPNLIDTAEKVSNEISDISVIQPIHPNAMSDILPRIVSKKVGDIGNYIIKKVEYINSMIESLKSGHPCIHKILTLIGDGSTPIRNLRVRIGTPISDILKENRIVIEEKDKIILGGPMRGEVSYLTDFPITHNIDALYVQRLNEIAAVKNIVCINCGECVRICPNKLQVNLLGRYAEFSIFEKCEELDIDYCIECGLCAYVCPAGRPLVQYIQFARHEIKELKKKEENLQ